MPLYGYRKPPNMKPLFLRGGTGTRPPGVWEKNATDLVEKGKECGDVPGVPA
jgi:hypothetical protein